MSAKNHFHKKLKSEVNKNINLEKKQYLAERLSYLELISNNLKISQDIIAGTPIIKINGRSCIYIENYKKILTYNSTFIKIQTKILVLQIDGIDLKIEYFNENEIVISGIIQNVSYL